MYPSHRPEYRNAYRRRRRALNKLTTEPSRHYLERYGVTREFVESLRGNQNNRCACCGNEMDVPHLDHNHTTGQVRGLVCFTCNIAIGRLELSRLAFQQAEAYLKRYDK